MSDIYTIMWKEWKDTLFQGGWRAWIRPGLLLGLLGVVEPVLGKAGWMALSPIELVGCLWVTLFVIISLVPDSFAGERERHTLETLLASRMPDRPILLGKVTTVVLYGWGVMSAALFLGAGVYNLVYGETQPAFYPIDLLLLTLVLGLLVGALGASAGVLLSLRISTVRQAQQTLMIGTLVVGGMLIALLQLLPKAFFQLPVDEIWLIVAGVVALLDLMLLAWTLARFQRAKLILS